MVDKPVVDKPVVDNTIANKTPANKTVTDKTVADDQAQMPWYFPECSAPTGICVANWARVLVLVPHPDDEALGCGGLLCALAQYGIQTRVVLVSNGDGAGSLPAGTGQKRQQEFAAAMATLHPHAQHTCWQLPDGGLSQHASLNDRLEAEIRAFAPSVVVAPWPGDLHPDHAIVGQLTAKRHARSPLPQGVVFYEVWSPLVATHVLDISAHWDTKQEALNHHQTALACGDYQRAMHGLASYRSLLMPEMARAGSFAEAFHAIDIDRPSGRQRYRFAVGDDGDSVRALFQHVFDTPTPPDWWQWKYSHQDYPGSVAFNTDNQLIGFYGAQERLACWKGKYLRVCQQGDVMVDKKHRFATRQNGVFASLSKTFLATLMGPGKPFAVSFGFPTPRAMALGEMLGLYQAADHLQEHRWQARRRWLGLGVTLSLNGAAEQQSWHWVGDLRALPIDNDALFTLVKNGEDWGWRFGRHPEKTYHVMKVKRFGQLRAAAVVKARSDGLLEVLDIALCQRHDKKWLWSALGQAALKFGCQQLCVWGTQTALDTFPPGERTGAGRLALPGSALSAPLTEEIKGQCWLLGGDTDFR